jgi:hypothetical protein
LSSSPWMRGAPQSGFSTLIRRIKTHSSVSICGQITLASHCARNASVEALGNAGQHHCHTNWRAPVGPAFLSLNHQRHAIDPIRTLTVPEVKVLRAYLFDPLLCFASHTPADCSAMKITATHFRALIQSISHIALRGLVGRKRNISCLSITPKNCSSGC